MALQAVTGRGLLGEGKANDLRAAPAAAARGWSPTPRLSLLQLSAQAFSQSVVPKAQGRAGDSVTVPWDRQSSPGRVESQLDFPLHLGKRPATQTLFFLSCPRLG